MHRQMLKILRMTAAALLAVVVSVAGTPAAAHASGKVSMQDFHF